MLKLPKWKSKKKIDNYQKEWRKSNKIYMARYLRQWKKENKEKIINWCKANKNQIGKRTKRWRAQHKEHILNYRRQYCRGRKEHIKKNRRRYYKTQEGKANIKACCINRRVLTKNLTGAIVQKVYEDNIKKYGTLTCYLCFKPIKFGDDSIDHATPLKRDGCNECENLGIAHRSCNSQKHTMTLEEWFKKKHGA